MNFSPAATALPAGYTAKDSGGAYDDTVGMGWVRQDSLAGTHVPYQPSKDNTRDRNTCTALPAAARTFIHMQVPSTSTTSDPTPIAWEYKLPNGDYQVTVGVGDASKGTDPESHVINVEGVNVVNKFPASPAATCTASRLKSATTWVSVADGKLTVDALGGTNTKLDYVTIDSVPVANLTATPAADSIALEWDDVDGASSYRVWRGPNFPVNTTTAPLGTSPTSNYTDTTAVKGSVYYYAVAPATGSTASITGAMRDDPAPATPTMPVKVNFTKEGGTTVAGYTADFGQNYANVRGYGWVAAGTHTPLSLVGNGRERAVSGDAGLDKRLASTMHMQGDDPVNFANVAQEGAWELAVVAGAYDIEVGVGDAMPGNDATIHRINVEGRNAVDNVAVSSTTSGADRFTTASLPGVEVNDGFLTVDAFGGGVNTKIDYITVTPTVATPPADEAPAKPTGLTATAGDASVALDWDDNTEADLSGYNVFRSTGETVDITGTPLNGTTPLSASAYTDTTAVNDTAYRYAVVAVDKTDHVSAASDSVTATPKTDTPPPPAATGCAGISTLACAEVPVDVPFSLGFDGTEGGLKDAADKGTGFTMVDPPSARLTADGTPTFASVPGYEPSKLSVTGGGLTISSTKGIAYTTPANSADTNSQLNALGVGVAAAAAVLDITTTVKGIDFPSGSTSNSEQGGLWFGLDEDNYVKLAVVDGGSNKAKVQLVREIAAVATATDEINSGLFDENLDVKLTLHVDGVAHTASATYRVGTGAEVPLVDSVTSGTTSQPIPTSFTGGKTLSDLKTGPVSFAGLFASSPNSATADGSIAPTFTDFSVREPAPADATAPKAPSGVAATAGDRKVDLTWGANNEPDLAGYRVYRSTSATVALADANRLIDAPQAARTFSDTTAVNGVHYYYVVSAVDKAGNESAASNAADATPAGATPADVTAPGVPQGLLAVSGVASVSLRWTPVQDADLKEYRVYRSTVSPVALTAANRAGTVAKADGVSFADTGRTNGTTLFYVVTAVDEAGNESAASAENSATPTAAPDTTAPAVPVSLAAAGGDGAVTLGWVANQERDDLAGYNVYRSAVTGTARTKLTATPNKTNTFVDTTVVNGTKYFYVVTAVDLTGNESGESSEVSATPADTTAPAVPAGLVATAGVNSVTLRWNANTEPDLRGYRIYRSMANPVAIDEAHLTGIVLVRAGRSFLDSDREPGTTYYYVITAEDMLRNESAASAVVSAIPTAAPDTTAPSAPTALTAVPAQNTVALSWTGSSAADLAGYNVYRSTTAGGERVKLNNVPQTGTTFTDTTAPLGATSFYVVTAVDRSNNESTASNQVTVTMAAPVGLKVKINFQTDAAPVPVGYTKDIGLAFDATRGFGWVREDSLGTATHIPLDLTTNTRLRTRTGIDSRLNTLIQMHYGDIVPTPTANGNLTPGAWEYGLPNGRYTVTVAVGDQPGGAKTGCAAPCYDSLHTVRVEGAAAISGFAPTAATEYKTGTATVDVADGKLTVDAVGGTNTKLDYVEIMSAGPVTPDTTAPGAPVGLTAIPGDTSATLTWSPGSGDDIAGYNVYRALSDAVTPASAPKVNPSLVASTSFTDDRLDDGTTYYYVVTAVDQAGNESLASAVRSVTPTAQSGGNVSVKVNFQDATTTAPAGYLADWGQSFGSRTGAGQGTAYSYGWVGGGVGTPLSLVGNGRNRNVAAGQPDLRLATFVHMQLPASVTTGVHAAGTWEMALPNGAYVVTVAVGDAGTPVDSENWINIENQNALGAVVPTVSNKFATATRTVVVSDGRLTLSPAGGTNTKLDYVDVAGFDAAGRPYPTIVTPANGATAVVDNASVTTDNNLNAELGAVDDQTLGGGNVRLSRVSDGAAVAGRGVTSGGADTISFEADAPLTANTLYRFEVTANVKDKGGRAFLPFSSVFTTSSGGTVQPPSATMAAFDKVAASGASAGKSYTSVVVGPDGKLYAGSIYGQIYRWTINADGTLAGEQVINTVRTHASAQGWEGAPNRTVIGLAFDPASTATNPILWITDNYAYLGQDVPDATGAISRLTGPDLEDYQEVFVNLPRSIKDHETNSLAFHGGKLFVIQGSMNAMGAAEGTWRREEHLLSASILTFDPSALPASLPVDVATPDVDAPARGGVAAHKGTYDPYAANAPLTFYATGIRNGFDIVWHSNGHLYTGVNGSAAGGSTPTSPATYPAACANRPDGGYTGPAVTGIVNNKQAETDYIFDINKGKYYGHPNPMRCEYVLNAGNPNGYAGNPLFKVNSYALGQTADPNYDLAHVYDAGLHASADGSIEYKNTVAFGGSFAGKLVVVRYSANQEIVAFDIAPGGGVSTAVTGITGFTGFKQPLDLAEDVSNGNLYVTELTDNPATTRIALLKPQGGSGPAVGTAQATSRLVFTDTKGGSASAAQNVVVKNVGGGPLVIKTAAVTGTDAAVFSMGAAPALPATVAPGGSLSFPVTFAPTVAGPRGAALTLATDDPKAASVSTNLRGLGVDGQGGANEPSLQWILDTLQIPVNAGDPDKTDNDMPATSAMIGDEIAAQSFTKALFDRPVVVEPISLFGPAGPTANPNVVTVAAHTSGKPAERTILMRGPNSSNQTVLPAFTPVGEYDLDAPFGFDFTWHGLSDRVAYSEDALNAWGGATPHKVRVYPLKNADGSVEANAYLVAPEDVPSPVDYQDSVLIVRNIKPVATSGGGKVTTSASELVFSGVKGSTSATQNLVVTNTGPTSLVITGATLAGTDAGSFSLTGGAQAVDAGSTATFAVRFTPGATTVGSLSALLRISSDATTPTVEVGLYGLATNGEQGDNEPPLQSVVNVLGRPIDVGGSGLILGTTAPLLGDEVPAPLFIKAATGVVTMKPVARYSPDELLPFGWYTPNAGNPTHVELATIDLNQEQTLNPQTKAGGSSTFDPGTGNFGFYVDSRSFNRKSYTQDGLNTGDTGHAARVYPAKDRAGKALANTYLVAFEDAANGDYQDYVFEVTNVRPAGVGATRKVARVNFQPATSAVPTGYTADTGLGYSAANGFGWVRPGTGTPLDMSALTRDRAGSTEARLRTLILMQPTASQSTTGDAAWEYAVANGTYTVTLSVGDPGYVDSAHRIQVEGQTAIASFTPTTVVSSRTATVTVPVTDGRLTIDAIGGTNTKLQYVDIDGADVAADTTAPTVATTVTGLQQSTGVYKNKATVTVTASDSGSGVASTAYSLNGAAFAAYTAPVELTTPGSYTIRARAQDLMGNIATTATSTFSVVVADASKGNIVLENVDGVPFADRLVMNRIQKPETGTRCKNATTCDPVTGPFFPVNVVHDVATLRIRNTGTEVLNVAGLAVTGPFALVNAQALPALVPVAGTLEVPVRFTATTSGTAGGLWTGTLSVTSDDVDEPVLPVQLAGFWQSQSENNQEPGVAEVAKLMGYGTVINAAGVPLNQDGLVNASGDEVLSPYWLRVNTAAPITVRQLAAFHTQGNTATISWHAKGSNTTTGITTHAGIEGQSILPHRNGSTTVYAGGTFTPTTAFGWKIDSEWSDDTKNNSAPDMANGCAGPCGHHMRFWSVRDRSGAIVSNTWLVGMDYSGINYDYNDNLYLVTNMKPETAANPAAPAPLPGAQQLQLRFDTTYPGTLADKDGETTGFSSTQPNKLDRATGSNSYDKSLLDVDTTVPGTLKVTSSGTATGGTNGSSDNTLVNGLQTAFDAAGGKFTVSGRLLGPVSALNAGSEQEAVQFGPDQDNYVKVAAINKNGVPSIEFAAEQGGAGTTIGTAVPIPSAASVTSLDLALVANPAAGTVKAAYRVNDGSWAMLPTTLTLTADAVGRFFDRQQHAGILVSNKGGVRFVATYDSFGVLPGDVTTAPAVQEAMYRLDVAGAGNYTDTNGNVWTPDTGRFTPATAIAEGATTTPLEIAGTDDDVLYRTYRGNVGNVAQALRVLSYTLPTKAAASVDLRLHFAERAGGNNAVGKRVFDIEAEGKIVRKDFDVFAAAGGTNTAIVLPVNGVAVKDGTLNLTFRAAVDYPSIAAIEVLCQGSCPVDTTAPAAPTGLTARTSGAIVALDWADNAEGDVLGYNVYRSSGGDFIKLNASPLTSSSYSDATGAPSATVTYRVTAVDSSGNESAASATASVTTSAPVATAIRINAGGPSQTVGGVGWTACTSTTACSGYVTGARAYANNPAPTINGPVVPANAAIYQSEWTGGRNSGIPAGQTAFTYNVPVSNGAYLVRLHFAENNQNGIGKRVFDVNIEGGRKLTAFDIYAEAGGMSRAIVREFPATVSDGKVTIDFVSEVENAKVSGIEILSAATADAAAPAAPTGLVATGSSAAVALDWADSAAADLVGYAVYRSDSATGTFARITPVTLTASAFSDTSAPVGKVSYYRVTAIDRAGNPSAFSATASGTRTDATAPAAPTALTAAAGNNGITVSWKAGTEADLAGYNVYRSSSATGSYTKLTSSPAVPAVFTDTTAPVGAVSYYQVTAVDTSANESSRSATTSATRPAAVDPNAPAAPAGVTATGSAAGIALGWAANTESDLAGYNVYRSASATGTFTKVNGGLLTGSSYSDTTAAAGAASYYRVTAVDKVGNESAKSATVSATRPAPVATTTVKLTPSADTYANAGAKSSNYGGTSTLASRGQVGSVVYLRFALPTAPAGTTLTGAVLHLKVTGASSAGSVDPQTVRLAGDSWSESGLTWNNRPALAGGSPLGVSAGGSTPGQTLSTTLDAAALSSLVGAQGTLAITSAGTDYLQVWSRNYGNAGYRPQLVLTYS